MLATITFPVLERHRRRRPETTRSLAAATDVQVTELMEELNKHGKLGLAPNRTAMDPKTAANYRDVARVPWELKMSRDWRPREGPFAEDWPVIADRLKEAPELEPKTQFEQPLRSNRLTCHFIRDEPRQLRTVQRRIPAWRATAPAKEVERGEGFGSMERCGLALVLHS